MPSKPAKYGIKVWWVCDAANSYPITGQIYTGKQLSGRETNQGERVVKDLCARFKGSGRNIVTDNFFTTLPLARLLISWDLSIVGTLKKNKPYVPKEMLPSRSREIYSSIFGFSDDNVTLCSYVPKKNRSVLLLSTQHYTDTVTGDKKKPEIIHYYNGTKGGVDNMDKLVTHYSTKRRTQRWPVAFFYNIIDVACVAAYKIYTENNPARTNKTHNRREFLKDLVLQLALPHVIDRSTIPNVCRNFNSRSGIECILGKPLYVAIPNQEPTTSGISVLRDSDGRIPQVGKCWICLSLDPKKRRNTRKSCSVCRRPVCVEHTNTQIKCSKC